jgi:hypothetical protein
LILSRFFALAALAAWGLALWGGAWWQPPTAWVLVDTSASCREVTLAQAEDLAAQTGGSTWNHAKNLGQILYSEKGLAALLHEAQPQPGDEVVLLTDGRVWRDLPSTSSWKGVHIEQPQLPRTPHIVRIHGPLQTPSAQQAIELKLQLQDADFNSGRVTIQARSRLSFELLQAPTAAGEVRLAVQPPQPQGWPLQPFSLTITWSDFGGTDKKLWSLHPDFSDATIFPASIASTSSGRAELRKPLDQHGFVFLASPHAGDWFSLPDEWRFFQVPHFDAKPTIVLLDTSGSMAGGALDQARDILLQWAANGRSLRVLPFSHELGTVLNLNATICRIALKRMTAFGSTQPWLAIQAIQKELKQGAQVILLSDGRPEGRDLKGALTAPLHELQVIPMGDNPDFEFLATLGTLASQDAPWPRQLDQALSDFLPTTSSPWLAATDRLFPLPASVQPSEELPFLECAAGAKPLMSTAMGAAGLVFRPMDGGWAFGFLGQPGEAASVFQGVLDALSRKPYPADLPLVLSSHPTAGPAWQVTPAVNEFTASNEAWLNWLSNQQEKSTPKPYPELVWAGLLLALLSVFLRTSHSHG